MIVGASRRVLPRYARGAARPPSSGRPTRPGWRMPPVVGLPGGIVPVATHGVRRLTAGCDYGDRGMDAKASGAACSRGNAVRRYNRAPALFPQLPVSPMPPGTV
jgi:hypothetical protein